MAAVTLQAIRDEEMQYCEAYEGRFGGVELKTDKKEETKKQGTVAWPCSEVIMIFLYLSCGLRITGI